MSQAILEIPVHLRSQFPKDHYTLDEVIVTWKKLYPETDEGWVSIPVNMDIKSFREELAQLI